MVTTDSPIVLHALGALVFTVGVLVVWKGLDQRSEATELARRERRSIADIRPGDGPVEISGTARPIDEGTIPAPIAETEGMVVASTVEESRAQQNAEAIQSGQPSRNSLVTIYEETRTKPFLVEGDTGTALVDLPPAVETPMDAESVVTDSGTAPPAAVEQFLASVEDLDTEDPGDRIYHQSAVEPGEEVYVVAEATAVPDRWAGPDIELTAGTDPDEVIVSDYSEERLVSGKQTQGNVTAFPGVIVALFGLFLFVLPFL